MIAMLRGLLLASSADQCIIDVGGVGYLVSASARTLSGLGALGSEVVLHIETHVREDALQLYGFSSASERDWFRLLQSVQGVGGRVALAILSVLPPPELAQAIARADKASVARANGVGPKLAQRIVHELKDKGGDIAVGPVMAGGPVVAVPSGSTAADALSALANLGFKPAEASRAVALAVEELGGEAVVGELVRVALKNSAR